MELKAYKGRVIVDPDSIIIKKLKVCLNEIKQVLDDDAMYNRVCIFIFLLCDLSNGNPLVDRPYNTRREEALEVAFGTDLVKFMKLKESNEVLRDLINKAMDIYLKEVNTDEQKDIATYSKKMDQFRVMLSEMSPKIEKNEHELNGTISYSTNMEIINSVLRDIVSLIQAKASMIALHTTGSIPKHLRGGLSPLSQGELDTSYEDSEETSQEEE